MDLEINPADGVINKLNINAYANRIFYMSCDNQFLSGHYVMAHSLPLCLRKASSCTWTEYRLDFNASNLFDIISKGLAEIKFPDDGGKNAGSGGPYVHKPFLARLRVLGIYFAEFVQAADTVPADRSGTRTGATTIPACVVGHGIVESKWLVPFV